MQHDQTIKKERKMKTKALVGISFLVSFYFGMCVNDKYLKNQKVETIYKTNYTSAVGISAQDVEIGIGFGALEALKHCTSANPTTYKEIRDAAMAELTNTCSKWHGGISK